MRENKREPTTKEFQSSSSISHFSHPGCQTRGLLCSRWFIIKETWLSLLYIYHIPSFVYIHTQSQRERELYIRPFFSPLVYSLFSCWPQHFNTTNHNHLTWRKKVPQLLLSSPHIQLLYTTLTLIRQPSLSFCFIELLQTDRLLRYVTLFISDLMNPSPPQTSSAISIHHQHHHYPVVQKSIFIPPFSSPIVDNNKKKK